MAKLTKLKIRKSGTRTEVMVLVKHPMETGRQQSDETNQSVPADYIDKMTFELNGAVVAEALLGPGVAADPLTGIALKKAKSGDKVTVSWIDSQGESGSAETIIS
ncbi:MAG: thiosulfate oxidation carrier complex protein SoxZ [Pseudomonadota bacterium]